MVESIETRNELFLNSFSIHTSMIHKYLYKITGDSWLVDDLEQETWFIVLEKMKQLKNIESAEPWIRKIAYSVAMQYYRKAQRSCTCKLYSDDYGKNTEFIGTSRDTLDFVILKYEYDLVIRAFRTLEAESQRLIWMRYVMNIKPREISQNLDLKVSTVKSRLHRALEEYRHIYRDLDVID
ncbi:RNA polymerase sigma factor [Aminipila terrae]|uniref:Sigma-70 family RNA polymerase sigma factor n=1 Tax=Aminipila terrae TaxID=2697030 RepID=A0A6P1MC10_9FIRM|nr:RNA polymerase sigma factor [Aminipila terrae]QHI71447.1 sigma-70 family RNA polymerase sigma factor [Aminipila terrae]